MLRFTISFTHSYSSDELSAVTRLKIDGLSNILEKGVKTGDMHPAGVQLFEEFWSSFFGTTELALRFPFVIMGVLSIWLTFLLGKTYLNKNVGIITAALLTITYFPIIHSELARPYSPGLLFALMVAWFWLQLIKPTEKGAFRQAQRPSKRWLNAIGLGTSFALAMYTHYFAFMFVGFIGLTGLIFIKKETLLPYLSAGLLGILLFLPHLQITIYHLTIDGGLGWLGRPDNTWLFQFIFHAFNESWYLILAIVGFIIIALRQTTTYFIEGSKKYILIFGIWFFGIYVIGHIFSLTSSPILKFPVMLFPLPFLFLLIGQFFSKFEKKPFNIVFGGILIMGTLSTVIEKDLYGNKHFGVFKELVEPMTEWRTKYGEENIVTYMNVSNPSYLNYYAIPLGDSLTFNQDQIEFGGDISIREELLKSDKPYCIVGYSARLTLPQVYETCKEFYPVVLAYKKLNNCAVFLLAKKGESVYTPKSKLIAEFTSQKSSNWKFNEDQIFKDFYVSDSTNVYGPDYIFKPGIIDVDFDYYLKLKVIAEANINSQMTITLTATRNGEAVTNDNGENLWEGHDLETMFNYPTNNNVGYFTLGLPKQIKATDDVQISLWNRNGKPVKIKSVRIEAIENIWN